MKPSALSNIFSDVSIEAQSVSGNTYYVATNGDDHNSCATAQSISSPRQTIMAGVLCLTAGDRLEIRAGTYTGYYDTVDTTKYNVPSGTSEDSRITIAAYDPDGSGPALPETVTWQPPDANFAVRLTQGRAYLTFQDLIFDGINGSASTQSAFAGGGVHIENSNHIRFLRVEAKNWVNDGFGASDNNGVARYLEFINCIAHNNGRFVGNGYSNPGYGLYINTGPAIIEGCHVYNNHGFGIALNGYAENTNDNAIIRNNRIHDNTVNPIPGGVGGVTGGGMSLMRGGNIQVYNNLVYNNGVGGVAGSASNGILVYSYTSGAKIYNNTVFGNTGIGISSQYYNSGPLVKNNIVFQNLAGNIYDDGGSQISSNNLTSDPLFVNAAAGDFRLTSSSAAIDAGTDVGIYTDIDGSARPAGGAIDIGAYEAGGSAPAATPAPTAIPSPTAAPASTPIPTSTPNPNSYSCSDGYRCDGSPVTGSPDQQVCGTDLQMWTCSSAGWIPSGTSCLCGSPTPTATPAPSATPAPAMTPTPTATPIATPAPDATPVPTAAPVADNTAPTVRITSPTNGAVVLRKSSVTITAEASDNVGVVKVEFYVNGSLRYTDTSSAYSFTWTVPKGIGKTFNLKARAYDAVGNSKVSPIVTVISQ
jgi:parallel beta-helix repeat protein